MAVCHHLHILLPEFFSIVTPKIKTLKNTTFRKKRRPSSVRTVGAEEGRNFFRNVVFFSGFIFGVTMEKVLYEVCGDSAVTTYAFPVFDRVVRTEPMLSF
jgi:hypothetical protein